MSGNNLTQDAKENILSHLKEVIMKVDYGRQQINKFSTDLSDSSEKEKLVKIMQMIVEMSLGTVQFVNFED